MSARKFRISNVSLVQLFLNDFSKALSLPNCPSIRQESGGPNKSLGSNLEFFNYKKKKCYLLHLIILWASDPSVRQSKAHWFSCPDEICSSGHKPNIFKFWNGLKLSSFLVVIVKAPQVWGDQICMSERERGRQHIFLCNQKEQWSQYSPKNKKIKKHLPCKRLQCAASFIAFNSACIDNNLSINNTIGKEKVHWHCQDHCKKCTLNSSCSSLSFIFSSNAFRYKKDDEVETKDNIKSSSRKVTCSRKYKVTKLHQIKRYVYTQGSSQK